MLERFHEHPFPHELALFYASAIKLYKKDHSRNEYNMYMDQISK